MEYINLKENYEYFVSLWENGRSKKSRNSSVKWNKRAGNWGRLLETESGFKRSLESRVVKVSGFLRERGLLGSGTTVADIGCGAGRFAAEFAKTTAHVTAFDISENMLELARRHAVEQNVNNMSYVLCDFSELDIEKERLCGRFDLVFSSITAAVGDKRSLEKAMLMSRGYCFNSSYIHNRDDLAEQIAKNIFGIKFSFSSLMEGRSFYSLFNILWLEGYYPETCYHKQFYDNMVTVDEELAEYYAWLIFKKTTEPLGAKERIMDYLQANADEDGKIRQYTERWYGWVLWSVKDNDIRIR